MTQRVGGGVKQDIEASDQDHVAKEFVVAVLQGMELCGCGLVDGLCGSIGVSALCVCDGAQSHKPTATDQTDETKIGAPDFAVGFFRGRKSAVGQARAFVEDLEET